MRNYEDQGVLPAAERSASGYRSYRQRHVTALAAFVALTPGCGHARAAAILRAVNRDEPDAAFALLDEAHRELAADRATLRQVRTALAGVGPTDGATPSGPDVFVGDVARSIGVVPATLRTWEREGIVTPDRDRATGYRVYSPADLRDARMAQQLRRGGYSLAHIATLTRRVREAGGVEPLRDTLDGWQASLTARGRALVSGAAALDTHLRG